MNKKELTEIVANQLRERDIRKAVAAKRHTFHITDDNGNTADFVVKQRDKGVFYTQEDVGIVIDHCLDVIIDSLRRGEEINIRGFGTLGLHKRAPRRAKVPGTGEWVDVEGRYTPKFWFGNDLRMAARGYELSLNDKYDYDVEYDPNALADFGGDI